MQRVVLSLIKRPIHGSTIRQLQACRKSTKKKKHCHSEEVTLTGAGIPINRGRLPHQCAHWFAMTVLLSVDLSDNLVLHPGQEVAHGQGLGVHAAGKIVIDLFGVIDPAAAVGLL